MPAAARARAALLIACSAWWAGIAGASAACAPGFAPAPVPLAPAVTAAENLLAWYKFESNFLDSSPNAHHASNPGGDAVFSTEAHLGDFSLRQDGFTEAQQTHVRFPNTFDFYEAWNSQGVSISLWFKMPLSPDAWANILLQFSDKDSDTWPINRITLGQRGLDNGFWLGINDPLLGDDVRYKQKNVLDGFLDDAWHHLVLRIAADGVWSLYIDSTDTGEIFTHSIPDVRYTVNGIGGSLWGDSLGTTGNVDDFRIYQKVLTAAEVAAIYAGDLSCDSGWTKMSHKCVRFFEEYVDWPTAQGHCAELGGSLAYARDQAGHDVLVDLWSQRSAASSTSYAWVGVSDTASEGSWTTIDGQALPYSKWCPNQPDNGANEDCVHLRSGYGSSDGPCYNDNVCSGGSMMHYFCEVDPTDGHTETVAEGPCIGCLPGHASGNGTACVACRPGEYTTIANATACAPCNSSEQSFRGGTACFDAAAFLAATGCTCP